MEKRHRDKIDAWCNNVLTEINIRLLWPRLIDLGVFNRDDVNIPGWEANLENLETIRDILLTIKTRGPHAYNKLLRSLRSTGHENLANLLEGREINIENNNLSNNIDIETDETAHGSTLEEEANDEFYKNLQTSTEPLVINVRKSTIFKDSSGFITDSCYPMRSKPRGLVLIITIINYMNGEVRKGAENDEENLKKLFENMGFQVEPHRNLTGEGIKRVVKEFSQRRELARVSSSFVIISAHGTETKINNVMQTEIHGVDYKLSTAEKIDYGDITDMFTSENCPNMVGKPKIFIYQMCRGNRTQTVSDRTAFDGISAAPENPHRIYSDILIAHSTIPGHFSYRDKCNGSWYIQILCEVFMNHAYTMHLWDLFCLVDRRLKKLRADRDASQTSTIKSIGFNKRCYLNPGLFDDS